MYRAFGNFGDLLNEHIWPRYLGKWLSHNDDAVLCGIGTLLGDEIAGDGPILVCGSGCGYQPIGAVKNDPRWKIFFVRGPYSARALGISSTLAITDPAILVDECFPSPSQRNGVVFVPHWETSVNPLWPLACEQAGITYVDPLGPLPLVIEKISSASLVVTEAMHGAIVADSFRVPWVAVSTSSRVNMFKWHDWAASLNMTPLIREIGPLGTSDWLRTLATPIDSVVTTSAGEVPEQPHAAIRGQVSALRQLIDSRVFSIETRRRIERTLYWRLGPAIDKVLPLMPGNRAIENAAKELMNLANQSGQLSEEKVATEMRVRVKQRLHDVELFLQAHVDGSVRAPGSLGSTHI
jgi:Polysaccharide pyruvyl transferase